jgi:hypothetical protein
MRLMRSDSADSVGLPLPGLCGERVGVRGGPRAQAVCPSPQPSPRKPPRNASIAGTPAYGEREHTECFALLFIHTGTPTGAPA